MVKMCLGALCNKKNPAHPHRPTGPFEVSGSLCSPPCSLRRHGVLPEPAVSLCIRSLASVVYQQPCAAV